MTPIRIAQIGVNTNSHSGEIFGTLKRRPDLFEIAGVVFPENERERIPHKAAVADGYPELTLEQVLADPTIEAVTVETDETVLTKYALLAAQHGKHVHMEKPGGTNADEFRALIDTVKKTGTVFHTGYMYRYNPCVVELMEQIERGKWGKILSVEAQMNCLHQPAVREWLSNYPGGMMFFLGCHLIDLIFRIQGTPKRVIPFNTCSGMDGVIACDQGMAILEYENGVSVAKTYATERGGFERRQLVVTGTKGTVELKPLEWFSPDYSHVQTGRVLRTNTDWNVKNETEIVRFADRYEPMMEAFAAMVRGEKVNPYTPDYEWELHQLILKACGQKGEYR